MSRKNAAAATSEMMNDVPPGSLIASAPSHMKRKKTRAQRNAWVPLSLLGMRRCIGSGS
jgi:hypothetical protein